MTNRQKELIREQVDLGFYSLRHGQPSRALEYYQTARDFLETAMRDPTLPLPECARYAAAWAKCCKLIERVDSFMKGGSHETNL